MLEDTAFPPQQGHTYWIRISAYLVRVPVPEIVRTALEEVVLKLKSLGVDNIYTFHFMNRPTKVAIQEAATRLQVHNIITVSGMCTLSSLPRKARPCAKFQPTRSKDCSSLTLFTAKTT